MDQPSPPDNARASDAPPVLPDGFELIRPLGKGKMARVYLAREPELARTVAVKVLRPELAQDETARLRFEREARSAASLTHPNVVSVYRFGRLEGGTPYLVMTHVKGRTLAERLKAEGALPEAEARSALHQIASGLAAAHKKGIVHRDVAPANVLVEEETGRYVISDFGIAAVLEGGEDEAGRLTRTGQILGDPHYASPEQLRGERVTPAADVYSFAVLAYEMLVGEGPFRASNTRELVTAHLTGEPRPLSRIRPGAAPDLEALLLRCLAHEPTHRPRAEDIVRRLEGGPATNPAGIPAVTITDDSVGLKRRRIPQIVLSTLTGCIGLIGFSATLIQMERLPDWTFSHAINVSTWAMLASLVLGWYHGEKGAQKTQPVEVLILAALAIGFAASTAFLAMR